MNVWIYANHSDSGEGTIVSNTSNCSLSFVKMKCSGFSVNYSDRLKTRLNIDDLVHNCCEKSSKISNATFSSLALTNSSVAATRHCLPTEQTPEL